MRAIYLVVLATAGLGLSSLQPLHAQAVASAEIHGVVTDPSGAVIAGAQVKATQSETGQMRTTVSNTDGSYVLPNLPVGPYSLEVSSQAFGGMCNPASSCRWGTTSRSISPCNWAVSQAITGLGERGDGGDAGYLHLGSRRPAAHHRSSAQRAAGHGFDPSVREAPPYRRTPAGSRKGPPATTTSAPSPSRSRAARSTATTTCWMAATTTTPLTT